jgi:tetratricopeptide (TPR) repeat protein/transcriptional regulator with XRE-family HTH domain
VSDLFGLLLRGHRVRAGLTQNELAAEATISVRALRNIEAGKIERPHPRTVRRLAEALGLAGADTARFFEAGESTPAGAHTPRQLPSVPPGFAGRDGELRTLHALLGNAYRNAPIVVVISGAAGVGKTALATQFAHSLPDRYPDGQLYADLRGFDPVPGPTPPGDVVRAFLHALGEPVTGLPHGLDAQSALLRSRLADRRMVLLLDNARDAAQVRPLLPGSGGCLVVVTSRDTLTALVATSGARTLSVDVLSRSGARRVLEERAGRGRVAAEPAAADEIIERCARLPLALVIVAARAGCGGSLGAIAMELRESRLDALSAGSPEADVRAAIDWSYRALGDGATRMFRALGVHPGSGVTVELAASAAGTGVAAARSALAELTAANLLTESAPGRFSGHDLLRAYAAELWTGDEDAAPVVRRMADHYLRSVREATALLSPYRQSLDPVCSVDGVQVVTFGSAGAARDWLDAELAALSGMAELAGRHGLNQHVWQTARELAIYLDRRGAHADSRRFGVAGLAAARRSGDRLGEAHSLRMVGLAHAGMREFERAYTALTEAMRAYELAGAKLDLGWSTLDLADAHGRAGRSPEAVRYADSALVLFQASDHRAGEAAALNALGRLHTELGDPWTALEMGESALGILTGLGDRHGQALAWDNLGWAQHHLGRDERAAECLRQAVELHLEAGSEHYATDSQVRLGDAYAAIGDSDAARAVWREALAGLRRLGAPGEHKVRERLARLGW